jgi:hypothetical protein
VEQQSPENATPVTPTPRQPILLPIVLVLLGISLGLHAWTFYTLHETRSAARERVEALSERIREAQGEVITSTVYIDYDLPINANVPILQTFEVPIDTTVNVDYSFDMSFAGNTVPVPFNFNVPISTTVPVELNENIDINTSVQLDTQIPITVPVSETIVVDYLDELHRSLVELDAELGTP